MSSSPWFSSSYTSTAHNNPVTRASANAVLFAHLPLQSSNSSSPSLTLLQSLFYSLSLSALPHPLLPLSFRTRSGFCNGMQEVFRLEMLKLSTLLRSFLSILSLSKSLISILLNLSESLDSLLCNRIASTPGLAFFYLMIRTLKERFNHLRQTRSTFLTLKFLALFA